MTPAQPLSDPVGIALWRQVADAIRADIRNGRYLPDQRIPADTALAESFGVNRHTVRRALAMLAGEGLILSQRGRGTFVTAQPERIRYPIGQRTRFSEIIQAQNREPRGRLISSGRIRASGALARSLAVPAGSDLIEIETLYMADGIGFSVTTSWFSADRFPDLVAAYAETGSLTAALARFGAEDYARLENRIFADVASTGDARLLGLREGQPVLVIESLNGLGESDPIQFSRARCAGDRVELLVRTADAAAR
ncbi:MAG: phosphonate metabolism transcriptional regulator PhnF [Rhodobiaceae bacterium]|nr:phosphonate metabolism transcriptional regulator PhnF [Rhodobiaceae bacterium]MCC0057380.1 phosphonate metabolism transcriptional regulator PhnF [Rhodobiaceae bacterium]